MAGAGFKTFNTGDVLTASDVNTYLMQQTVMVFDDAAARTSALGANVAEGMLSYLEDTDAVEKYDGSAWSAIGGGGLTSPLTTKGDVWGYSTTDARIPVGANGTVLTADSAETLGLKWATPAGGSKTYTLLNTGGTALSGSSTVTVNVTTKEDYYIIVIGASCASRQVLSFRINGDTGNNYISVRSGTDGETNWSPNNINSSGSTTANELLLATMSSNAGSAMNAGVYVGAGNSTTLHPVEWQGSATPSTGNAHSNYVGTAIYSGSAAITSFTVFAGANFDAGTVYVYGA
jgi:hypothetical protein